MAQRVVRSGTVKKGGKKADNDQGFRLDHQQSPSPHELAWLALGPLRCIAWLSASVSSSI
jgi:hypothetical protein